MYILFHGPFQNISSIGSKEFYILLAVQRSLAYHDALAGPALNPGGAAWRSIRHVCYRNA
jgi:hypothetical protein